MRSLTSYDYQAIAANLGASLGKRAARLSRQALLVAAYPVVLCVLSIALGALTVLDPVWRWYWLGASDSSAAE